LLLEIRDLLRTKIRRKAEQRKKAEDEVDKKKDWKFAADVIDRVLLIIFTILFVTGTLIFSVTAAVVYRSYHHHHHLIRKAKHNVKYIEQ